MSSLLTATARGTSTAASSCHSSAVAPVDVVGGRDDEDRRVRGTQAGPELAHEVGEPGGVDEVDGHAVALERGDGQPDRSVALALLGTSPRDTGRDEMVEQRGLTGSARTDEDDVANVLGGPGLGRRG